MFFKRRRSAAPEGPSRGRGGGRVRARGQRRARARRPLGLSDFLFLGAIAFALVVLIEHFLLKASWGVAAIFSVLVAASSLGYNAWRESRRKHEEPRPRRRRR